MTTSKAGPCLQSHCQHVHRSNTFNVHQRAARRCTRQHQRARRSRRAEAVNLFNRCLQRNHASQQQRDAAFLLQMHVAPPPQRRDARRRRQPSTFTTPPPPPPPASHQPSHVTRAKVSRLFWFCFICSGACSSALRFRRASAAEHHHNYPRRSLFALNRL
jgi:hypothetical protein